MTKWMTKGDNGWKCEILWKETTDNVVENTNEEMIVISVKKVNREEEDGENLLYTY